MADERCRSASRIDERDTRLTASRASTAEGGLLEMIYDRANIMFADKSLRIETCFEPDSLIGRQFEHGRAVFELGSILRAGPEGIVYEARDMQTGKSERTLKVYRRKLAEEEVEQKQASYRRPSA